ncbi:metal ABC transporter ATP-binding protein [Deinococcus aerophilus]|uniref:Manganese transporter n=1 Tax=Deinococcus aerophilus TaxID=522488 RepID=A0ABQ2GRN9_9DEIO|nr:metal ABC transporter ATP-binding protein [Deinococcus aerophilus]GGM09903.1 manganese transporter [Deinococcus aerophilus]
MTHDRMNALEVHNVSVAYGGGRLALRQATLEVQGGSVCGLVGMNGAGKSTLFKTVMGFLPPLRGTVQVFGQPVNRAQKAGLIAYVPQSEDVDWNFPVSVREVVMMGRQGKMGWLRRPSAADHGLVEESLERVGMGAFAERQIGELSGGQRKRAFLARALAQEGRLLLLDEPFGGVDVGTSEAIIALMGELRREGRSMLVSTHDLGTLESFCDEVALIADRTVLLYGPTGAVLTAENLAHTFGGRSPLHAAPTSRPEARP